MKKNLTKNLIWATARQDVTPNLHLISISSDSQTGQFLFMSNSLILCIQPAVVVGMPVTRHPPHSPGRAVFPHPVPRLYSLPHRFIPTRTDADVSFPSVSVSVSPCIQELAWTFPKYSSYVGSCDSATSSHTQSLGCKKTIPHASCPAHNNNCNGLSTFALKFGRTASSADAWTLWATPSFGVAQFAAWLAPFGALHVRYLCGP